MSTKKQTVVASVHLHKGPGGWTNAGRKRIAKWLRSRADYLEKHGDLLTEKGSFTARYYID